METNKKHCRDCGELKSRTEDGKYPDGRNKRYINEAGKLWVGARCPECVVKNSKENMRKLRIRRELDKQFHTKDSSSE